MTLIQYAIQKYEKEEELMYEKLKNVFYFPEKDIQRNLKTLIGTTFLLF